ncbi:hypothetical protein EV189_2729 [Motilibacter rhizosphaerae]|uniref:Smu12A n=1 Tax=Motilibacter rhizosphaerae TaxID=598652 RepID=A0A4Q7NPR2_9ACTN|nr:hypothetical protein [Motilibacter rhizosphaerae]RZS87304.1 hypothetical protein EV189_2729 [Motilibacter rhizosphaerae]
MTHQEHDAIRGWFAGRLPDGLFAGTPEVTVDREEVLVVGPLDEPALAEGASDAERAAALQGRVKRYREETREQRMALAAEAEHRFGRKVAWGVRAGGETWMFTNLAVPVMTRLRQRERVVLDTLVDAGVARSRADALAWCVRLVGQHADEWLGELRQALEEVERVRGRGPGRDSA